jgi:hypothetical protein
MTKKSGLPDFKTQASSFTGGFAASQIAPDSAILFKDFCYSGYINTTGCSQVYLSDLIAVAFSHKPNAGTPDLCYPNAFHKYTLNFAI